MVLCVYEKEVSGGVMCVCVCVTLANTIMTIKHAGKKIDLVKFRLLLSHHNNIRKVS